MKDVNILSQYEGWGLNKPCKLSDTLRLFVGDQWMVFVGPPFEAGRHKHHAAQWSFSADGAITAEMDNGQLITAEGVFIPPDCSHSMQMASRVLMIYWEPEHSLCRAYLARHGAFYRLPMAQNLVLDDVLTAKQAESLALRCIRSDLNKKNHDSTKAVDYRVVAVQDWVRANIAQTLALEFAAKTVHISPAHLSRLFRTQCGTTFRAFVRWARLRQALDFAFHGATLTEAAHRSGFADSAHLSRTFRAMFGVAPDFLFGYRDRLHVEIVREL